MSADFLLFAMSALSLIASSAYLFEIKWVEAHEAQKQIFMPSVSCGTCGGRHFSNDVHPQYVPFDKDWWDIGLLEPEFVQEIGGYHTEKLKVKTPVVATWITTNESRLPLAYIDDNYEVIRLPQPEPWFKTELKWKKLQP